MRDVIIKIKGIQGVGEEKEVIEFSTDGKMDIKPDKITLLYDEGQMLEGAKIKTCVEIAGDTVITERSGDMNSRLIVEKNKKNSCFYVTPYGELSLGIYGDAVENSITSRGGRLRMCYSIDAGADIISRNDVTIEVREIEE